MTHYIISARELGKLRSAAGLHVREVLDMTDGEVIFCKECKDRRKEEDGDLWCTHLKRHVEPNGYCNMGW